MEKWIVRAKRADFALWAQELGIDPVTARVIRNRDVETIEEARAFLYGTVEDMHSPWLLKDMDIAVNTILDAIKQNKSIRVIGDYDVDGVTSAYILTKGLRSIGGNVSTAIPHRIHDGYGLNDSLVSEAHEDGVELIVTCDNGISATTAIDLAGSFGMEVVVTDHHEVPFEIDEAGEKIQKLPNAIAVVNPKRFDDTYPFPGICGAMVAYKLIQALTEELEKAATGNEEKLKAEAKKPDLDELLQFVALGTVCDVMELKGENRIAVRTGIRSIAHTKNAGLEALIEVNGLSADKLTAFNFGFVLGPCINATGRLDSAIRALEMFCCDKKSEALKIATELKELNDSRKNLTNEGIETAEKYIEEKNIKSNAVYIVFLPEVHESIAGIIAGRIREKYNHPAIVLTRGEGIVKGSGRSIDGYHMQEHLTEVSDLLEKFGGHAMAAGLSIDESRLEEFDRRLNERANLSEDAFIPKVNIDVPMPLDYTSMKLAKELEILEPFGTGNESPVFAQKDLQLLSITRFGSERQYGRWMVKTPEGRSFELVSFDNPDQILALLDEKYGEGSAKALEMRKESFLINVVYRLDINRFRGNEKLQYIVKHYC